MFQRIKASFGWTKAFSSVVAALAVTGAATSALASPGCDAVNSIWGGGISVTGGQSLSDPWPLPAFAVGDRITYRAITTGTSQPNGGGFAFYEDANSSTPTIYVEQYAQPGNELNVSDAHTIAAGEKEFALYAWSVSSSGTVVSAMASCVAAQAAPTITSVSPTAGPTAGGTSVTITGTNFTGVTGVKFGAANAAGYNVNSSNQIVAVSPSNGAGTVNITVTTSGGTSATAAANQYTYVAAPTVASVSPAQGTTAGGQQITISGSGFTGATDVTVGGASANGVTVVSASQITATTPAGATGSASVEVTTPSGTSTSNGAYVYIVPPTATAQAVTTAYQTARPITLQGTDASNYAYTQPTAGTGNVSGTGPNVTYTPAAGYSGNTSFTFTTTNGSGPGALQSAPATVSITVHPQAPVTLTHPSSQVVTAGNSASFTAAATGNPTVQWQVSTDSSTFNDIPGATSATYSLTATSAENGYRYRAVFTNAGGTANSNAASLTVTTPAPTISAVSPNIGYAATPASVTITGANFGDSGASVTFGGVAGTVTAQSNTSITVTPPTRGTPGAVAISVTSASSQSVIRTNAYTYVVAPTASFIWSPDTITGGDISALKVTFTNPNTVALSGIRVTIPSFPPGFSFTSFGAQVCSWTGNAATTTFTLQVSANQGQTCSITINYRQSSGGAYTLTSNSFTTASAGGVTLNVSHPAISSNVLQVNAVPTVTSLTPNTGTTEGGQAITLAGSNFTGTTGVTIGGVAATDLVIVSDTSITATTPAHAAGAVDVVATNSYGPGTRTNGYTYVAPTVTIAPASGALPTATGGLVYSQTFTASGATASYSYAVTSGSLPAGLTLSPAGSLTGTTTSVGSFNFSVTATDSSTGPGAPFSGVSSYSLSVAAPIITIAAPSLPVATVATAYGQTLTASGGVGPYGYSITAGALPAGLTLASDGSLSGTPTAGGDFSFTVTAADTNSYTGARAYTLTVVAATVVVSPTTLPDAQTRIAYSQSVTASGGVAPYSYAVSVGALPVGLTLSPSGILSGSTTTAGSFSFTVRATDSATGSGPYSAQQSYTLIVGAPSISLSPATVSAGTAGVAFSQTLTASSGTGPYAYVVTAGTLPAGISLSSAGVLSGTPTVAGSFTFTATATDANGNTGARSYTLTIGAPTVVLSPSALPNATGGVSYSQAITASGGTAPYAYTVKAGVLPTGLTLSPVGILSGTPTAAGSFTATIQVTDANGFGADQAYTMAVDAPTLVITPAAFAGGTAGVAYSQTITASGGTGPYGYAVTSGALPTGITLSANGELSGTATAGGTANFTVTATDTLGFTAVQAYSLEMTAQVPTVEVVSANVGYNSTGETITLRPSGVYTVVAIATAPVHGAVSLNGEMVTYVPANGFFGQDSFTYTATGPGGTSTPATVSITVAAPPPPVVTPPAPIATVTPPAADGTTTTSVDLAPSSSGVVSGYRITGQARFGAASIQILTVGGSVPSLMQMGTTQMYRLNYVAPAGFMGTDTVTVVAEGPGGDSAPATFTFNIPGRAPDLTAQAVAGQTLTVSPTTSLIGGPFQGLRITRAPSTGTATIQGLNIVYTPATVTSGPVSLDYVVVLSFGESAAGTLNLQVAAAPIVAPIAISTPAGRPVTVSLTATATGGPFTAAVVTGLSVANAGTTVVAAGGTASARTYDLTFTPAGQFTGRVDVNFTLSNAATTTTGVVQVTVVPRPDPSLDPDVRGVVSSQVDSARRFAGAQTDNFNRRLEQIRQGRNGGSNMLNVNAGFAAGGLEQDPQAQLRQQLGGTRMPFGDEALRARLGLQNDAERDMLGREGLASRPFADASSTEGLGAAPGRAGSDSDGASSSNVGVWAAGGVDWGRRDATTGTRDYRFSTSGVSVGSDMKLTDTVIVGVGAGYGFDHTRIGAAGSHSEGRSTVVAAYGGWRVTPSLSVDGVIGYGDLSFDTRRWATAANAGQGAFAFGDRKGDMAFGSLSLVWEQRRGQSNRSIYGRVEAQSVGLDAFTETGGDIYALTYDQLNFDSLSSTLGFRYDWRLEQRHGSFTPSIRLEWSHAFDHAGPQSVTYADWLTSPRYAVGLDAWDRDTVELGLEGGWKVGDSFDLSAGYRASVGEITTSQGLQMKLMTRF